jgi:hypothetical protein
MLCSELDYKNTDEPTTATPTIAKPQPMKCLFYKVILIKIFAKNAVHTIAIPPNIIQVEL